MGKDELYRDRILWRAKQHKLFDKNCCQYSNLKNDQATFIANILPKNINPVIVFLENTEKWTVLGTRSICSYYDANLVCAGLDKIEKKISLSRPVGVGPEEARRQSNFLCLDKTGQLIWAPAGDELFALWNILRMFPLKDPAEH